MSATTEHIGAARAHRPTIGTLRLRLKPAHPSPIDRLRYHQSDWSPTPPSIKHQGGNVTLDARHDSPNVITVFGEQLGRLALLVVPPYTDTDDAYAAMTTAASVGNASTPDRLLGFSARSAKDRHHARIALQQWDCAMGM